MPRTEDVARVSGASAGRPAPDGEARAPSTGRRAFALAFLALAAGTALSLIWLVRPWYVADDDAAMYVLTARSLVAGEGFSFLGIPFVIRPPGFPILIAPVLWLAGTDFLALNLFVSLFGVAAVLLLFAFEHRRIGLAGAFAVAVAVWLNPAFQRLSNQVMSDVPGAALLVACLLFERRAAARPGRGRELALACAIAAAAYVRTMNVLLVPAIAASRLCADLRSSGRAALRPRALARRLGILVAVPWLLLLPWSVRNTLHHPEPPVDQTSLFSYSTGMWNVDEGDPSSPRVPWSEVAARPRQRGREVLATLGSRMRSTQWSRPHLALGALMLGSTLFLLVRERRSSEFFVLGTVAVMAFYFDFARRLVLPAYLLALPATVEVARGALARLAGGRAAAGLAAAGVLAMAAADLDPHWDRDRRLPRHLQLVSFAQALEERLEEQTAIASGVGWHLAIYTERPVYSLFWAFRRSGIEGIESVVEHYAVEQIVLLPTEPVDRQLLGAVEARFGPGRELGEGRIYDVR